MRPGEYLDTYRAYKRGTERISKWLIENAASNQDFNHDADVNAADTEPTHNTAERADLIPLAKEVAEKQPPVSLPDWFLPLLRDVIRKRAECSQVFRYRASEDEAITRSNHAHEHFVGILKHVLAILSTNENSSPEREDAAKRLEQPAEQSSHVDLNKFAGLAVEEPIDDSEHTLTGLIAASATSAGPASSEPVVSRPVKTSTAELDQAEFEFACFSLAHDYFKVREHLRGLWKSWVRKETSLIAASATTNVAIHSLRVTSNAAWKIPHNQSLQSTIKSMESTLAGLESQHELQHSSGPSKDSENANSRLVYICGQLRYFIDARRRNRQADFRQLYSSLDWKKLLRIGGSPAGQMRFIICRAWPDMDLMMRIWHDEFKDEQPIDEISRAAATVYEGGKLELWMILALDIFVELHFTLLYNISDPWEELKTTAQAVLAQLKHNNKMQLTIRVLYNKKNRKRTGNLEGFINLATTIDTVADFRAEQAGMINKDLTPFYLMKHHPVLCGTVQLHILRNAQILGLEVSKESRSLISTAHLYNALKNEGIFKEQWNDMETFMSFYTPLEIFHMETPPNAKKYIAAVQLSNGMRIADMAQAEKDRAAEWAMGIEDAALLISSERAGPSRRILQVKTLLVEVLQARHSLKADTGHALHEAKHILFLKSGKGDSSHGQDLLGSFPNESTTVKFLTAIAEGVMAEERQLGFNFLSLNWICLTILRQMREKLLKGPWEGEFSKELSSDEYLFLVAQHTVGYIATGSYKAGICAAQMITALGPEKQSRAQSYV